MTVIISILLIVVIWCLAVISRQIAGLGSFAGKFMDLYLDSLDSQNMKEELEEDED